MKSVSFNIKLIKALEKDAKENMRSFSGEVSFVCQEYFKNKK